jgi:hypothetical protein
MTFEPIDWPDETEAAHDRQDGDTPSPVARFKRYLAARKAARLGHRDTDTNETERLAVECLLAFDTGEPEFARGFEVGLLWGRMIHESEIVQTIHAENAEMVIRMAEAYDTWTFTGEPVGEDRMRVVLARTGSEPEGSDRG